MKAFSTIFSVRAVRESNEARAWLEAHLGTARVLLLNDEVNAALDKLELLPELGAIVRTRSREQPLTRRVILDRSGYHLYYRVHHDSRLIEVVCLWHEKRRPPRL
jgi:plasmid stabilization system protein ParE